MSQETPQNKWVRLKIKFKIKPIPSPIKFIFDDPENGFRSELMVTGSGVHWLYRGAPRNPLVEKFSLDWTEETLWLIQRTLAK